VLAFIIESFIAPGGAANAINNLHARGLPVPLGILGTMRPAAPYGGSLAAEGPLSRARSLKGYDTNQEPLLSGLGSFRPAAGSPHRSRLYVHPHRRQHQGSKG
jgi:hypothetical protein